MVSILKVIGILFCLTTILSCSTIYPIKPCSGSENLELTNFCEINQLESGSHVSTIAYYTGFDEYWGLTSNTKCELDNEVYLNTQEMFQEKLNKKLSKIFSHLHENDWKYSLKLEITGKLEKTEEELGFGHLGQNKMQINPCQIEILERIKKSGY